MKFGVEYQESLKKEEYPPQWIDSALSYKKLKKCIKRVREELLSLGLDQQTLEGLWQHVGSSVPASTADTERMVHYQLTSEDGTRFVPKLTIALDPHDGSPMDAWLSPQTRRALQKVGKRRTISRTISRDIPVDKHQTTCDTHDRPTGSSSESSPDRITRVDTNNSVYSTTTDPTHEEIETIEIPLTSDSEFFQILRKELSVLDALQTREKQDLESAITSLGHDLQALKSSRHRRSRAELDTWREIFRLYIESEIFMSNHESDAGVRPATKAAEHYTLFTTQLSKSSLATTHPKTKSAHIALDRFLTINTTLLRLVKFQELNRRALSKILKKFDKQTHLHALPPGSPSSTSRSETVIKNLHLTSQSPTLSPSSLARATAATISNNLLSIIPQLDDYLCPICAMISYKPIRLRCNHIFCIRCMIRLQRDNKDECPLCREHVVLDASEDNLDRELKAFLKREFAGEVAEKKRENELMAGRELFGEGYNGTHRCVVM